MSETAIAVRESNEIRLGTLQANTPEQLLSAAANVAKPLAEMIGRQGLANTIQGRSYVRCEGWTTMGAMLGVVPREVSNMDVGDGVYVATVELVNTRTGEIVGRASAECGNPDELDRNNKPVWAGRPAYARRSMAATRATSKAFRLSFSWIMTLAGYEATPAEEMHAGAEDEPRTVHNPAAGRAVRPIARPSSDRSDGQPVWRGKIIKFESKDGMTNGKPWTLFKFIGQDGTRFGTFDEKIAQALSGKDGRYVEIAYEAKKNGNDIIDFKDITVDEADV